MKTGYESILQEFVKYIGNTRLEIKKDRYQSKIFIPNYDLIRADFSRDSVYGFGADLEEACEECFNKLIGKSVISVTGEEINFDLFLEEYRRLKKERIKEYPTFKEYKKIISESKPRESSVRAKDIRKEIINGHELTIFPYIYDNYYYLYDINYPDQEIENGDFFKILIHDLVPIRTNRKYLISKCELLSKNSY